MTMDGEGGDGGQGGGGGGAEGGGEGGANVGQPPAWMATLPEDLRADATLARYPDVEKLARGALDLRKLSASRVIVPGENAAEGELNAFYSAIGRPEAPDKYEVPVPEGSDASFADAFRPAAFKLGLTGLQARGLAEFNNMQVKAREDAYHAQAQSEVDAVKAEIPEYPKKIEAARNLFRQLGGDDLTADELALKLGSGKLVKFMIGLADRAGELARVGGDGDGFGDGGADPDATLNAKSKDAGWRDRAKVKGSVENAEYEKLVNAIAARRTQKPA